jgi:hypothetical protein
LIQDTEQRQSRDTWYKTQNKDKPETLDTRHRTKTIQRHLIQDTEQRQSRDTWYKTQNKDNLETLDTRHRTKTNQNEIKKKNATQTPSNTGGEPRSQTPSNTGGEPRCSQKIRRSCFLQNTHCITHVKSEKSLVGDRERQKFT